MNNKLAAVFLLAIVFSVFSFSALAQAPIAQDKPVASTEPVIQQCSINEEISLSLRSDGSFELRYTPKVKPTKKGAVVSKTQVLSFKLLATCGSGNIMEWTSTSQGKKGTKQSVLRVTSIGGITGIAVPSAEISKSESLPNAEPVVEQKGVQLKKLQGRFLVAVMERLAQFSHDVSHKPALLQPANPAYSEQPLRVDPVLAQDIITLFASSQKQFYSAIKAKKEKKAKEPAAIEPVREDIPKADPIPPAVVKPMPMPVEKGM